MELRRIALCCDLLSFYTAQEVRLSIEEKPTDSELSASVEVFPLLFPHFVVYFNTLNLWLFLY